MLHDVSVQPALSTVLISTGSRKLEAPTASPALPSQCQMFIPPTAVRPCAAPTITDPQKSNVSMGMIHVIEKRFLLQETSTLFASHQSFLSLINSSQPANFAPNYFGNRPQSTQLCPLSALCLQACACHCHQDGTSIIHLPCGVYDFPFNHRPQF